MRKFWIDRDQWLPYIDVLKMNLEEANASWFKKEYESRDFKNPRSRSGGSSCFCRSLSWYRSKMRVHHCRFTRMSGLL